MYEIFNDKGGQEESQELGEGRALAMPQVSVPFVQSSDSTGTSITLHSLMSGAGINERGGSMSLAEKALIKKNVLVHIDTFWNKCLHFPLPTFQFSGQEWS